MECSLSKCGKGTFVALVLQAPKPAPVLPEPKLALVPYRPESALVPYRPESAQERAQAEEPRRAEPS